jgi:hypothetical protein
MAVEAGLVDFMAAAGTTAAGSTEADWAAFMAAGSALDFTDFTMAGSTGSDFTATRSSSVDRSHLPGGAIIQTMGITITANPTLPKLGITAPTLQAITLM